MRWVVALLASAASSSQAHADAPLTVAHPACPFVFDLPAGTMEERLARTPSPYGGNAIVNGAYRLGDVTISSHCLDAPEAALPRATAAQTCASPAGTPFGAQTCRDAPRLGGVESFSHAPPLAASGLHLVIYQAYSHRAGMVSLSFRRSTAPGVAAPEVEAAARATAQSVRLRDPSVP